MDLDLSGKVAVVLSSSAGIGRGIAEALASEGCALALCAREPVRLSNTASEISEEYGVPVHSVVADVSQSRSLNRFFDSVFERYGRVDILVNNTGGPIPGRCLELEDQSYIDAFNLVLMSKVIACKRVLPLMEANGWGRIINIESTSAKSVLANMALSNMFRAASASFTKTMCLEHPRRGVRFHTLLSGPFMTDRVSELGQNAAHQQGISFEDWKTKAEIGTPLGRFGQPHEYGNLVAFLASEKSSYLNGTTIAVDGGILAPIM